MRFEVACLLERLLDLSHMSREMVLGESQDVERGIHGRREQQCGARLGLDAPLRCRTQHQRSDAYTPLRLQAQKRPRRTDLDVICVGAKSEHSKWIRCDGRQHFQHHLVSSRAHHSHGARPARYMSSSACRSLKVSMPIQNPSWRWARSRRFSIRRMNGS